MKTMSPSLVLASALIGCFLVAAGFADNSSAAIYYESNNKRPAAELYKKYCTECHGRDGRAQTKKGKHSHARDLADAQWQDDVSDERIFNSIMNGRNVRGNMPAFSKQVTEDEAEALVTYVRQLRK